MALLAGTVSVADNESVTGNGMARALYDADAATLTLPAIPALASTAQPFTTAYPCNEGNRQMVKDARLVMLRDAARRANAYAAALVDYLPDHLDVTVTVGTGTSVGRVPTPATSGTPIDPPSAPVDLTVVIA